MSGNRTTLLGKHFKLLLVESESLILKEKNYVVLLNIRSRNLGPEIRPKLCYLHNEARGECKMVIFFFLKCSEVVGKLMDIKLKVHKIDLYSIISLSSS